MSIYKLDAIGTNGGDRYEREYYGKFIQKEFPNYEVFWEKSVVPLTNRPADISFKSRSQLSGISDVDVQLWNAQLHYTLLFHLCYVYDLKVAAMHKELDINALTDGIVRLASVTDLAFEMFGRKEEPKTYLPIDKASMCFEARKAGFNKHRTPSVEAIRKYRNFLVHSSLLTRSMDRFPKIGSEETYLDWSSVMEPGSAKQVTMVKDFTFRHNILAMAWKDVLNFLNDKWNTILLK